MSTYVPTPRTPQKFVHWLASQPLRVVQVRGTSMSTSARTNASQQNTRQIKESPALRLSVRNATYVQMYISIYYIYTIHMQLYL